MARSVDGGNMTSIGGVTLADTDDLVMFTDASVNNVIQRHYADLDTMTHVLLDDQLTYRQIGMCATSEMIFKQPFRARLYILKKS